MKKRNMNSQKRHLQRELRSLSESVPKEGGEYGLSASERIWLDWSDMLDEKVWNITSQWDPVIKEYRSSVQE